MNPILEHNRKAWDNRATQGQRFARPATDEDFQQPLKTMDGPGWLGDVANRHVLCLAAGGGRHGPLLASAGAQVTVVDLSPVMLALDREVATARGLRVETVEASIDDLSPLPDAAFDIVIQPVSTCYVPDIRRAYSEVARVTRAGGLYSSRHKQPTSLQVGLAPMPAGFVVAEPYFLNGPLSPPRQAGPHREQGTMEFLHRWADLLGGLCQSGFVLEDVLEPKFGDPSAKPGSFEYRGHFVAPYIQFKARRTEAPAPTTGDLWTPPA
jgi:SAM-dependent methyltransferase